MTVDLASLVLRLVVGAIFVAQGWRKLLAPADAPHGRAGLAAMIDRGGLPAPAQLALLIGTVELVGGALLGVGLLTRVAAVPLMATLAVAVAFKWRNGFISGWDWPLSVLGGTAAIFLLGGGAYALDAVLGLPF